MTDKKMQERKVDKNRQNEKKKTLNPQFQTFFMI